jgi:TetR/AcrR family transcriptional regulator, transcriptional repressor for nem operon
VQAAVGLILRNGFHATGVDAICEQAGVTKGSFFHHFKSKDDIGLAVISWWSAMGTGLYAKAWEDEAVDPLDQLFAMLDIMESFANRPDEPCVCAIGMMAQEMAATHPEIRQHCSMELNVWTQNVATLLTKAQAVHKPAMSFEAEEVAWYLNSLWQGSMLIAKTREDQGMIVRNLRHARAYLQSLFFGNPTTGTINPITQ